MANRPLWSQKQSVFPGAVGSKAANFGGTLATTVGLTAVAAVTGKKIRLRAFNLNTHISVVLNGTVAPQIAFTDSTTYATGVVFHAIAYGLAAAATQPPISSGLVVLPLDGAVFETTAGNALGLVQSVTLGTTGTISVSGTVWYDEI